MDAPILPFIIIANHYSGVAREYRRPPASAIIMQVVSRLLFTMRCGSFFMGIPSNCHYVLNSLGLYALLCSIASNKLYTYRDIRLLYIDKVYKGNIHVRTFYSKKVKGVFICLLESCRIGVMKIVSFIFF